MTRTRYAQVSHTEHGEQCSVIEWALNSRGRFPQLQWLFAIPNGGHRHKLTALRLQLEGVKAGVSDLMLPAAVDGYHGLFIEMKIKGNGPTESQCAFQAAMRDAGYAAVVCYGFDAAVAAIERYLLGTFRQHEEAHCD